MGSLECPAGHQQQGGVQAPVETLASSAAGAAVVQVLATVIKAPALGPGSESGAKRRLNPNREWSPVSRGPDDGSCRSARHTGADDDDGAGSRQGLGDMV